MDLQLLSVVVGLYVSMFDIQGWFLYHWFVSIFLSPFQNRQRPQRRLSWGCNAKVANICRNTQSRGASILRLAETRKEKEHLFFRLLVKQNLISLFCSFTVWIFCYIEGSSVASVIQFIIITCSIRYIIRRWNEYFKFLI